MEGVSEKKKKRKGTVTKEENKRDEMKSRGRSPEDGEEGSLSGASEDGLVAGIQSKIVKTKEQIKREQRTRDDNVDEYLKLSSNADRAQQSRIKQVFEKKNQKSAQSIAQYQKKLEEYSRRLRALEEGGGSREPHVLKGLKNVGGNIRDGTKSFISKPKELLTQHLLKHKYGSENNLSSLSKEESPSYSSPQPPSASNETPRGSASLPRDRGGSSLLSAPNNNERNSSSSFDRKCISEDGRRSEFSESLESERPSSGGEGGRAPSSGVRIPPSEEPSRAAEWKAVFTELALHKEEVERLREDIEDMRSHFKQVLDTTNYQLREERDRYERLEEQMNDLTELHQHEIENIKSGVNDMEEKVQYQSDERLREITEHLQSLETKITSLEHQQAQQQYLNIEGLDSTNARAIMMKLITAALTILHVILFVIGIFMNIAKPFFQSTARAIITVILILGLVLIHHQWQDVQAYYVRLKKWRSF